MSGNCGRKHTPIVSEAQRGLFGAVAAGKKTLDGLSKAEAARHLREVKGKKLPARANGRNVMSGFKAR
jgi:hypothetical protein